jgi:hypothetical protein
MSQAILDRLEYCPTTGVFTWKNPRITAGTIDKNGYHAIKVNGKTYKSHRLAFLFMTGDWPKNDVDHINGTKTDNSWKNLRDVTTTVNMQNQTKAHKCNKSKYLGVTALKGSNKWRSRITVNKRQLFLGMFETAQEAHEAYLNAKKRYHVGNTL